MILATPTLRHLAIPYDAENTEVENVTRNSEYDFVDSGLSIIERRLCSPERKKFRLQYRIECYFPASV